MTRKNGLPICEHITTGRQLQDARALIMSAVINVQNAYPKASKAYRAADRALDALDVLRCELDNVSAGENPDDRDWAPNIYYGSNREMWEETVPPILARHQESNPTCCTGEVIA